MRANAFKARLPIVRGVWLCVTVGWAGSVGSAGCGRGSAAQTVPTQTQVAIPTIVTLPAQGGALIVSIAEATAGSSIHYTLDGSIPTGTSPLYLAPFLVVANGTVRTYAALPGNKDSPLASKTFTPNVAAGTLVWSDEFLSASGSAQLLDEKTWAYDTGNSGFGNQELEYYCAAGSSTPPCSTAGPNAFIGSDGFLHIVARRPSPGVYTSARMKTQGLFSFQYGRVEARMKLPESQGMWPAFWLLGSNITIADWPASGELDVMEHIDGSNPAHKGFDWVQGSIHGTGLNGGTQYHPAGFSAADWHTYGMIWKKGEIDYYVDDPANVYASFPASIQKGTWPFDDGPQFLLLNLAVGGNWPGNPDTTTPFPSELLVDYVRLYAN